jgi:hypothetical protein
MARQGTTTPGMSGTGEEGAFALRAGGDLLFASKARSGPFPLRCTFWAAGPVLRSQEGSGEEGLSRYARGIVVIAFNARSSPVPLPPRVGGAVSENKNGGPALEGRTAVTETV